MEEVTQKAPELEAYEVEVVSTDKDYVYLTIVCMKPQQAQLEEILRCMGFIRPSAVSREIPAKLQEDYEQQIAECQEKIVVLEELIREYAGQREDIRLVADYYRARAEKYKVLAKIPQTKYTFGVSGYVPAGRADAVAKEMEQKFDALVEVSAVKEEEAPILLKNNGFSDSVESVVESFGLPGKGEFDPTFVTSIFYVFLFGMMLSDAAYGLRHCVEEISQHGRVHQEISQTVFLLWIFHLLLGCSVRRILRRCGGCYIGNLFPPQGIPSRCVVRTFKRPHAAVIVLPGCGTHSHAGGTGTQGLHALPGWQNLGFCLRHYLLVLPVNRTGVTVGSQRYFCRNRRK